MFGISLSKLLVLALISWVVWYLFRLVRGFGAAPKVTRPKSKARFEKSQETIQCPTCKVYVVAGQPHQCAGKD